MSRRAPQADPVRGWSGGRAPETLDDLAAHAHESHVVVVGGGIGGLVAALACAKIGMRVTLLEASDRLGGALWTEEIGGLPVDVGAEGYATRGGAVRSPLDELGLDRRGRRRPPRAPSGSAGCRAARCPLPEETVRGIPENPWDERVRRADRLARRMAGVPRPAAPAAHDRAGAQPRPARPHAHGRPRARSARRAAQPRRVRDPPRRRRRRGRRARAQRRPDPHRIARRRGGPAACGPRDAPDPPGDALEGIDGGMSRLVDALRERLRRARRRHPAGRAGRRRSKLGRGDGRWTVRHRADEAHARSRRPRDRRRREPSTALRLLAAAVPDLRTPVPAHRARGRHARRRARAALAASAPRTGGLRRAGARSAASVTDSTARWPWLRAPRRSGRARAQGHLRRPRATAPATAALDDAAAPTSRSPRRPPCWACRWSVPRARGRTARGTASRRPSRRSASATRRTRPARRSTRVPGLAVVGAWLAGTGIAQVVPDALARGRAGATRGAVGERRVRPDGALMPRERRGGPLAQRRVRGQRMPESAYGATLGADPLAHRA